MTSRKKPGVAFWATVALVVVLVGYPLSIGPAAYMAYRGWLAEGWRFRAYQSIYAPLIWLFEHGPAPIHDTIEWYVSFWIAPSW